MSKGKTVVVPTKTTQLTKEKALAEFAFGRINYVLMLAGLALIFLGYVLMSGGGSDDPKVFNPAIFDSRRLVVAPIVTVLGYVLEVFAIVIKAKD
jgi:uncharacterized membrane protein